MFTKNIWTADTGISAAIGNKYLIEGYVYLQENALTLPNLNEILFKPVGYTVAELDTYTAITSSSTTGQWIKINTTFTAKATGTFSIGYYIDNQVVDNNIVSNQDSVSVKGPLDELTEKKTIIYDSECLYKNFHVKFLDSLGGYSYWTFRTYGDKGVNFGDTRTIKRNIFADFPTDFKKAQVQTDFVGVESKDTITLRAENLTEQQAIDLFELVRSVRVYDINGTTPKVLIVDKNSLNVTQGEKLYNLTFNATSTFDNYRQRQ